MLQKSRRDDHIICVYLQSRIVMHFATPCYTDFALYSVKSVQSNCGPSHNETCKYAKCWALSSTAPTIRSFSLSCWCYWCDKRSRSENSRFVVSALALRETVGREAHGVYSALLQAHPTQAPWSSNRKSGVSWGLLSGPKVPQESPLLRLELQGAWVGWAYKRAE